MKEKSVVLRSDGHVAWLTLNRPEVLNAINLEMAAELTEQLAVFASNEETRALVITGNGKGFCAGGDLKWILGYPEGCGAACRRLAGQFHTAIAQIRRMGKPVLAAINGVAAGGGFSLALACDFRVMSEGAVLRQAYTSSGLCIDGGGTFMLPRLVGLARAMEIAALDRPIDAAQAHQWGLASEIAATDQLEQAAATLAGSLLMRSPNSFAWSKRLMNESFQTSLEAQLERERAGIVACASHPDGVEGLVAFNEKREPRFGGVTQETGTRATSE